MRFLFVRPEVCPWVSRFPTSSFLQIPPHDGHPCLRLCLSRYRADLGLAPLRNVRRQAHQTKRQRTGLLPDPCTVPCFIHIHRKSLETLQEKFKCNNYSFSSTSSESAFSSAAGSSTTSASASAASSASALSTTSPSTFSTVSHFVPQFEQ